MPSGNHLDGTLACLGDRSFAESSPQDVVASEFDERVRKTASGSLAFPCEDNARLAISNVTGKLR
jgi:hypothetical protein